MLDLDAMSTKCGVLAPNISKSNISAPVRLYLTEAVTFIKHATLFEYITFFIACTLNCQRIVTVSALSSGHRWEIEQTL